MGAKVKYLADGRAILADGRGELRLVDKNTAGSILV
jgi:hypothetical protein